jgi:tripartite-type tricarboxylate transporter receptor subunit TctC
VGLALLSSGVAAAQAYPGKPVTLVVPFAAGSGTDAVARVVAQGLSQRLKQTVVIDNRAGANGQIGVEVVARAQPDGYTLLMTTSTSHSINPGMYKHLRYDPVRDFTPIARTGVMPFALVVKPDMPVKSVQELLDYAGKRPAGLSFAASNSAALLAGESLGHTTNTRLLDVEYKSAPQALTDLLGGHVDMNFVDFAMGLPAIRAGHLRALGVTMARRSSLLPQVAAIAETVPGFDLEPWNGIFGPAGLPAPIADRLAAEVRAVLEQKDVQQKLAAIGFEVMPTRSRDEFARYVVDQMAQWGRSIKQAGIEPQ